MSTIPANPPKKPTAVEKLAGSRLHPTQLELLGDDVDLSKFYLSLNHKGLDIEKAVLDVSVERTIEGASTVTATVQDQDRILLRSGKLSARNDTEIDGLFFRLVSATKSGSQLSLVFEDREISILRTYNKPIKQALSTNRLTVTRAEFALRMLREVKELPPIPYVIPELRKVQPIGKQVEIPSAAARIVDRVYGIPKNNQLTVKGVQMSENQRQVANAVLDTGVSRLAQRKVLVMAMMACIQESSLTNLTDNPDGSGSVGVFQQIAKWGWPASRDIPVDAAAFYAQLIPYVAANPNLQYYAAIQHVQKSAFPSAYAAWRVEAERIVTDYGLVSNVPDANAQWNVLTTTGNYEFYRGIPPTATYQKKRGKVGWGKESSWDCFRRLANEVQWRAFFVSGTFYFIAEDDLFQSQPIAVIDEDTAGILSVDGDYDEGTKSATVTVTCLAGRWAAPPGTTIQLINMGPWDGRWLVNDVIRSLFDPLMTITLKKPLPRFPEPSASNISQGNGQAWHASPAPAAGQLFRVPGPWVQPVPQGYHAKIVQGVHDTVGLPGYPAADFGGSLAAPVIAVESGKIVKCSGHDPSLGPTDALLKSHGPFGLSVYLLGNSGTEYYYTHLGTRSVVEGQVVAAGQILGSIGNYAKWGGVDHVHLGVHPGDDGHPDITDIMNSLLAVKAI